VLDFQKVKQKEREQAKKLFESEHSSKQILKEISQRQSEMDANLRKEDKKGQNTNANNEVVNKRVRNLEELIEKATSLEEMQELEKQIRAL
jgi:hypothetical protein